jgi:hypothetical protein
MKSRSGRVLIFLAAFAVSLLPSPSNANDFHKVTVSVMNADGTPSVGQRFSTSFDNTSKSTDAAGSVKFELPTGNHRIQASLAPNSEALNKGTASTYFNLNLASDVSVELKLPTVLNTSLKIENSQGVAISHIPQSLETLGCAWMEIAATGLADPLRLSFAPPRFTITASPFISRGGGGLRAQSGKATIAFFQMTRPANCPVEDLGNDGLVDYRINTAAYQDWQIIDSASLLKGDVVVTAPEAPIFRLKYPMYVLDTRDYQQTVKVEGQLAALHPSILAKQGRVTSMDGSGNWTNKIDSAGNFALDVYINKSQTAPGAPFSLRTDALYVSEFIPTPPRFSYIWAGQNLRIEAAGLTADMGVTKLLYGKSVVRLSSNSAGKASFDIRNASPATILTYANDLYQGKHLLGSTWGSCSLMWKDFPGGLTSGTNAQNKGAKALKKPTIWKGAYNLNKSLDKDKDGIVCER